MKLKCDWCGKEFDRKPAQIKEHNYCCRSCLGKANGERSRKSHFHICANCGKKFERKDSHGKRNQNYFCSTECASDYKTKKLIVCCEWCGKEFQKKRSDIRRTSHNFCTHDCYLDYINMAADVGADQIVAGEKLYRYIAGVAIGRKLTPNDEVHHIDGDHRNNSPENLMVVSSSEHSRIHASMKSRNKHGQFIKKI